MSLMNHNTIHDLEQLEFKQELQRKIEEQVLARLDNLFPKKGQKRLTAEADIICGAAIALQVLFGEDNKLTSVIPPIWIINPMSGRPIIEEVK